MKKRKAGFTLVELMIVAVIVAILAAVAIPLMSANKQRAVATEGEAGLGTLRTALRAMYAQTEAYNADLNGAAIAAGDPVTDIPGIGDGDLNGKFFVEGDYSIEAIAAESYTLQVEGSTDEADGIIVQLNSAGDFSRTGL